MGRDGADRGGLGARLGRLGPGCVRGLGHLLSREDPEISSTLEEVFRSEGIALELGVQAQSIAKAGAEVVLRLANGKELRGSRLLVAVDRRRR